jgi:hypothetical protein
MSTNSLRSLLDSSFKGHRVTRVVFCLCSDSTSSDTDVYCLIDGQSFIDISMNKAGHWIEIFADNRDTLDWKLQNGDEILMSFFADLTFAFGNKRQYLSIRKKVLAARSRYKLPDHRLRKLQYRLITLSSKLLGRCAAKDSDTKSLILGAVNYPLVQLVLSANGVCPGSPKKWMQQAKACLAASEYKLLLNVIRHGDLRALKVLMDRYISDLDSLSLDRSGAPVLTAII